MAFNSRMRWSILLVVTLLFVHQSRQQDCGRRVMSSRIVGGSQSSASEFPWMAHLDIFFWSKDAAECGGTLISNRWVLTAAHCLYGAVEVNVTLGVDDIRSTSDPYRQVFNVPAKSFYVQPSWYYGNVEDDIALLDLQNAVVLSERVQPACLPFAEDPDHVNDRVVLTGRGNFSSIAGSGVSPVIRKVDTTVVSSMPDSDSFCHRNAGVGAFTGKKVICSDGSYGRRYCYGDDGGPMNYYNAEWDRWFVIGVTGRGESSSTCQSEQKPQVFTRVSAFLNWISGVANVKPLPPTTTTTTTTTTKNPNYFDCEGKPNGNYPNPASKCSKTFYMCSNGYAYLFDCAQADTYYREDIQACDWFDNVPGCR